MMLAKTYWKQLAAVALILFIFLFGWYKGNAYQKAKFEAFVQSQKELAIQQQARNDLIKKNQNEIILQSSNDYNETIKRINNHYAKNKPIIIDRADGLHNTDPSSNAMPSVQKTASAFAEGGGNENAISLEHDCAITTAQYNSLHEAWDDLCKVSQCE
jgi:hypothetical protein